MGLLMERPDLDLLIGQSSLGLLMEQPGLGLLI